MKWQEKTCVVLERTKWIVLFSNKGTGYIQTNFAIFQGGESKVYQKMVCLPLTVIELG